MKKKTTEKTVLSTHTRPDGSPIHYYHPHSPFQRLVEERRLERNMTVNQLAGYLGKSQSSVWIWIHNENGYPAPRGFDLAEMAPKFKQALGITTDELKQAIDDSRRHYTPNCQTNTSDALDEAFQGVIRILEAEKSRTITVRRALKIVRTQYDEAKQAEEFDQALNTT